MGTRTSPKISFDVTSPEVGRPGLNPITSPERRYSSGMYSASALRHSTPTEKPTGPAGRSKASPPSVAASICCSAFVVLVALILIALTAASERFWPKILATGAAAPTDNSAAAYRLRDAAPAWRLLSSERAKL